HAASERPLLAARSAARLSASARRGQRADEADAAAAALLVRGSLTRTVESASERGQRGSARPRTLAVEQIIVAAAGRMAADRAARERGEAVRGEQGVDIRDEPATAIRLEIRGLDLHVSEPVEQRLGALQHEEIRALRIDDERVVGARIDAFGGEQR